MFHVLFEPLKGVNGCRSLTSARLRLNVKINDEYGDYKQLPAVLLAQQGAVGPARPKQDRKMITAGREWF